MREREEKRKKGVGEEVSIDPIVLTQLWSLNVVKRKIEEHKTSVCHRAVCCSITDYYLL